MKRFILCATVTLALAGVASAVPAEGDRILMDVGHCWGDQTPEDGSAPDGNFWNNSGGRGDTVNLKRASDGADTGAVWSVNPSASGCDCGGQITYNTRVSNLYVETAQSTLRFWGDTKQPAQIMLTGMGSLPYDIGFYSYLTDGIGGDDQPSIPVTPASTVFTLVVGTCPGAVPITLDAVDNTTEMAWFRGVTPDASGAITFELTGAGTATWQIAALNVVDITAVPEPGTMLLLLAGGTMCALRRRKR